MAITININNLTLIHKDSGGVAKATLPDICLTPAPGGPVPRKYSNTAYSKDIAEGTVTITADGGNMCANRGSQFSKSYGDEPGTLGGIISGTNMAEATWLTWSPDVLLEGRNACRLTDKMLMNHGNTACLGGILNPELEKSEFKDELQELCDAMCNAAGDKKIIKKQNEVHKIFKNGQKNKNIYTEKGYNKDSIPGMGPTWRRTDATITTDGRMPGNGNIGSIVEMKFQKEMQTINKSKKKMKKFLEQIDDNQEIAEQVTGSKDNFILMEECDPSNPPEDTSTCCYCVDENSPEEWKAMDRAKANQMSQEVSAALALGKAATVLTSTNPISAGAKAFFRVLYPVPAY